MPSICYLEWSVLWILNCKRFSVASIISVIVLVIFVIDISN